MIELALLRMISNLPICRKEAGILMWLSGKRTHLPMQETQVQSLGQEDPLEKEMATHSSIPAWEIPWTEEAGGLQSMGWKRIGSG